jgi:hypothetical protein
LSGFENYTTLSETVVDYFKGKTRTRDLVSSTEIKAPSSRKAANWRKAASKVVA